MIHPAHSILHSFLLSRIFVIQFSLYCVDFIFIFPSLAHVAIHNIILVGWDGHTLLSLFPESFVVVPDSVGVDALQQSSNVCVSFSRVYETFMLIRPGSL